MPLSKEYLDRVIVQLNNARPITHRKMFGGAGFYAEDVMFAIADDDRLYFKVDAESVRDYDERGMEPWSLDGKPVEKYRQLPAEVLQDPEVLGDWIDAAIRAATALASKSKRRK